MIYKPRAGGWARLNLRLMQEDLAHQRETQVWRAVAAVLLLTTVTVASVHFEAARSLPAPAPAQVALVRADPGVRILWVF